MVFRGVGGGVWSDKWGALIINGLRLEGYKIALRMAYLKANGWSLRKTVYIWGRSVENVEWAMRGASSKNTRPGKAPLTKGM